MSIKNYLYHVLLCFGLIFCEKMSIASEDQPRVQPPHALNSNEELCKISLPPTGTGKPIVKSSLERMQEDFDALIYDNRVDEMRFVLNNPDQFTVKYGFSSMTAQDLCNMRRKTGNMSLHLVAARAYKDVSMAKLFLDHGVDMNAENSFQWTPLDYPNNIKFSKYLIARGAKDNVAYDEALAYRNREKIKHLNNAEHLRTAYMIMRENSDKKMSSKLNGIDKEKYLLDAIFIDKQYPSLYKLPNAQDVAPVKVVTKKAKAMSLDPIKEETLKQVLDEQDSIAKPTMANINSLAMKTVLISTMQGNSSVVEKQVPVKKNDQVRRRVVVPDRFKKNPTNEISASSAKVVSCNAGKDDQIPKKYSQVSDFVVNNAVFCSGTKDDRPVIKSSVKHSQALNRGKLGELAVKCKDQVQVNIFNDIKNPLHEQHQPIHEQQHNCLKKLKSTKRLSSRNLLFFLDCDDSDR